jgi:hypothetical protein
MVGARIAEAIREEHRAAIDWLNASTIEGFNFCAVEVEALRIGNSPPAPWFSVVAKPNNWSRGVVRATRSADSGPLDDRVKTYTAYWSGFGAFLQDKGAPYKMPDPRHATIGVVSASAAPGSSCPIRRVP